MSWIEKELSIAIEASPANLELDIRIFITGTSPTASVHALNEVSKDKVTVGSDFAEALSDSEEKSGSSSDHEGMGRVPLQCETLEAHSSVMVEHGRPHIGNILTEEITASTGSVSVNGECLP